MGGKGITRVVFVQCTGLSSLARTYTYKHAHTHLPNTEAYCGHPCPVGPRTTDAHCVTLCLSVSSFLLSFPQFYLCFSSCLTSLHTAFNFLFSFHFRHYHHDLVFIRLHVNAQLIGLVICFPSQRPASSFGLRTALVLTRPLIPSFVHL